MEVRRESGCRGQFQSAPAQSSPIDIEQTTARAKVIAAGYDPEMTYDMVEYLCPSPYGGSGWTCKWVGQAALEGCAPGTQSFSDTYYYDL